MSGNSFSITRIYIYVHIGKFVKNKKSQNPYKNNTKHFYVAATFRAAKVDIVATVSCI